MKKLLVTIACCLLSSAALAAPETSQGAKNYLDQTATIDRFRELERMDVTSEREAADPDEIEPISVELESILDDAESLESSKQ